MNMCVYVFFFKLLRFRCMRCKCIPVLRFIQSVENEVIVNWNISDTFWQIVKFSVLNHFVMYNIAMYNIYSKGVYKIFSCLSKSKGANPLSICHNRLLNCIFSWYTDMAIAINKTIVRYALKITITFTLEGGQRRKANCRKYVHSEIKFHS